MNGAAFEWVVRSEPKIVEKLSDSEEPGFSEDERITASMLRNKSLSPQHRFLAGTFALIPRAWRGPIVTFIICLIAFACYQFGPVVWERLTK